MYSLDIRLLFDPFSSIKVRQLQEIKTEAPPFQELPFMFHQPCCDNDLSQPTRVIRISRNVS